MSTTSYEVCDKCRREMTMPLFKINKVEVYHMSSRTFRGTTRNYDLCNECGKKLELFIKGDSK